jgi:hypothetical protein
MANLRKERGGHMAYFVCNEKRRHQLLQGFVSIFRLLN